MGLAIGAGTDVAVETADVVLMNSDPASVAQAISLARRVRSKISQNRFWAAIYNVLAIPFAAGALYLAYGILLRPEWAALLKSASTVIVYGECPADQASWQPSLLKGACTFCLNSGSMC